MTKVLFIASHRLNRAPAQRFRFEQYFNFLESNGVSCELSNIISEKQDAFIYQSGHLVGKFFTFSVKSRIIRLQDILKANKYDTIFVNREAMLTRSTFFERYFAKSRARLIFDFDDAIWKHNVSEANKRFAWLKNPSKTDRIIGLADIVIAGNQYLADYASSFAKNIRIIPTTINTDEYLPPSRKNEDHQVCIGWSGSITTIQHYKSILPVLYNLKEKYGSRIIFKLIGDEKFTDDKLGLQGIRWHKDSEVKDLSEFDIGIMPLPDDEWAKGKCGLKGLQYMALETPTLMSPVGVNSEIINDGVNGYLPIDENDWIEKLSLLIESAELRKKLGKAARETVVEKYSFNAWKNTYLDLLK